MIDKDIDKKGARVSISKHLSSINNFTVTLTVLLMLFVGVILSGILTLTNIIGSSKSQVGIVAENVSASLLFQDRETATEMLASLRNTTDMTQTILLDSAGRVFAYYSPDGQVQENHVIGDEGVSLFLDGLAVTQPVVYQGQQYGVLYMEVSLIGYYRDYLAYVVVILVLAFLVYWASRYLAKQQGRSIVEPILSLTEMVQDVTWNNRLDRRASKGSIPELNVLVDGFNSMLAQIESKNKAVLESRDKLEMEVSRRTEELLRAKNEAEHASRAKSRFLSQMSHELRTPMNAILGFSQILESFSDDFTADQREYIREIIFSGQHLLSLIEGVLDLSRIESESGEFELSPQECSLEQSVRDAVRMVKPLMDDKKITLSFTCEGLPCNLQDFGKFTVKADTVRLKQVFINLLSNAIKYNHKKGRVFVDVSARASGLRISVRDTGVGISQDKQSSLFKPFERLGFEGSNIQGAGIGLVISKHIMERMGGRIGLESEPGEGGVFWVELPSSAVISMNTDIIYADSEYVEQEQGNNIVKILYIEDNRVNLRLVEEIIKREFGCTFLSAVNPINGLEIAEAEKPTLILLDINLPEMDGYEVVKRLKESPQTRDIPVVAVSANALTEDIQKALDSGFDEYLTKPFKLQDFASMVKRYLPDSE